MDINLSAFVINICVNFFDFVIYYYLCNNIIEKKPKISKKLIFIGSFYAVTFGILGNILDRTATRVICTVTMILILKWISKRKIHDILIVFGIIFLCTSFIQVLCLSLFSLFNLRINDDFTSLLGQTLTVITALYIYIKVPLYKLMEKIERGILLKLFTFLLTGIVLFVAFYWNFEYTLAYILYFSVLIILAFIGFYRTLKKVFYYTNKIPMQLHDVKNILMGIQISAYNSTDLDVVRKEIDRSLEIMGMDRNVKDIKADNYSQNILSFIERKKSKAKNELIFLTDINYYEANVKVAFSVVLYMLGVLVDNAIESGTKKAIIIGLSVIEESLLLSVSNEYQRKSADDFNKMFQERYSTKEGHGSRGYGLSNLSKVVADYGGKILLKEEYRKEQRKNYLTITIKI